MLVFGVILAAVSFIVVLAFGSLGQPPQQAVVADVPVVVASQNLTLGTALTPEMMPTVNRSPGAAVDTYQHPEELVGFVVRRAVAQGAALVNEDFLTGVTLPELVSSLQPGLRAVAVPLSRVDSVGALLQAGDYVDVILTIDDLDGINPAVVDNPGTGIDGDGAPYVLIDEFLNNTTVKVVVQNVQVLAALPRTVGEDPNAIDGSGALAPDVIAILAVQPRQVEVIRFAQLDGHIRRSSLPRRTPLTC